MSPKLINPRGIYPPAVLLISLLWFIVGMVFVFQWWFPLYLAALIAVYLLFGYGRTMLRMTAAVVILCLLSALFSLPSGNEQKLWQAVYRMALFGLTAVGPVGMEPVKLVRAMNGIGVSRGLTSGLLVSLRFMRILGMEMGRIRRAMRLRGVSGCLRPRLVYRALIVPFLIRLISLSDTLSLSLETRGFRMENRAVTAYEQVRMGRRDWCFTAAALCVILLGVILKLEIWK
ncbi:MAG: energy-coupling factor transporter transmembrane component T [Eubacteriales bacterium]|nr:energy-coupling factor transporter transmembrane component T [Eubacteriales bacterium]